VSCSSDEVISTRGWENGVCLPIAATTSVLYQYPDIYYYSTFDNCSGPVGRQMTASSVCLDGTTDDNPMDYLSYTEWSMVKVEDDVDDIPDHFLDPSGQIAGITVGVIAAICILSGFIVYFGRRDKSPSHGKTALSEQEQEVEIDQAISTIKPSF
jgi:hypothetical protein